MNGKSLIVIVGPTAVGKTSLAIAVAEHLNSEIISADSRQIFRELEIGTAKPSLKELLRVKHHFVDHQSIADDYDAGKFGRDARILMDSLFEKSNEVLLVGGSGLYVKAAVEGFDELPAVPAEIRTRIIAAYDQKGLAWLQHEVASHDPDYFEVVDRQNPQRLMRALEVIKSTGKKFSGFRKQEYIKLPFRVIKIGLERDRTDLYARIDQRMDDMIGKGLFEEAEKFFPLRHLNALQTVGYQEAFQFMEGGIDRDEAIRLMKRNSRRYAKRQLTWFKHDKAILWFHAEDREGILNHIQKQAGDFDMQG